LIKLCGAFFTDHFGKKGSAIRSINNDATIKYSLIPEFYQPEQFGIFSILTVVSLFIDQIEKLF